MLVRDARASATYGGRVAERLTPSPNSLSGAPTPLRTARMTRDRVDELVELSTPIAPVGGRHRRVRRRTSSSTRLPPITHWAQGAAAHQALHGRRGDRLGAAPARSAREADAGGCVVRRGCSAHRHPESPQNFFPSTQRRHGRRACRRHRLRAAAPAHLATAVAAGAEQFVTNNRKDFPARSLRSMSSTQRPQAPPGNVGGPRLLLSI